MEILRSRSIPAKGLLGIEELFDVPAFGKGFGKGGNFVTIAGGQEGFEFPGLGCFAGALDELIEGAMPAASGPVEPLGGGKASPAWFEKFRRKGFEFLDQGLLLRHRDQQMKRLLLVEVIEQLR